MVGSKRRMFVIDGVQRYVQNPLLLPEHVRPSMDGLVVECVLNPGAFRFAGKIGLLLRVAERPAQDEASVKTVVIDPTAPGGQRILAFQKDDPDLVCTEDSRGFVYRGQPYLT